MAKNVTLKTMKCPTCGASLKAENGTDTITCVYCGNSIVPVIDAVASAGNENASNNFEGVLRVEGIKTASSALAYIEQYFEEYDWEAFAYAQTLSISKIDKLASSLKDSAADDKNTWFVYFQAVSIPYVHKIAGCKKILNSVVKEYKNDNLDAYSTFDAYKRIASMIADSKDEIVAKLKKIVFYATKYGATATEINGLNSEIENIVKMPDVAIYSDVKSIPEIKEFTETKNAKIAQELATKGIDADNEYSRAKSLINEKNYKEALKLLLSLKGYRDSDLLIEKIDKYYLISNVLEVEGNLYYLKKESVEQNSIALYPTVNKMISEKPLIKGIEKVVANYADVIYYLDTGRKLKCFNLSTNLEEKLYNKSIEKKYVFIHDRHIFMLAASSNGYSTQSYDLIELDLEEKTVKTLLENVKEITSLYDDKMIYTVSVKDKVNSYEVYPKVSTNIINLNTLRITALGTETISIKGFVENFVVYTKDAPNKYNKELYVKDVNSDAPEKLIEQNIYEFCDIISGKLFYYIGNSKNKSLINVNCDGTARKEWPLYISNVLFEQGGWLYFIRKAGYNSVLCKSCIDGSKFSVIAADIDRFIEIKNGYLYYINDVSALVKVRMDGSNFQKLCEDVETVLAVKEDKVIFVSVDDRIVTGDFAQTTTKIVKSIYAVDFSGSGKIKLAYDIKNAKKYDGNTVYYISSKEKESPDYQQDKRIIDTLYKIDVETNAVEKLLDLEEQKETKSSNFIVLIVFMAIAFLIALIGFAAESPGIGIFGLISGIVSMIVGITLSSNKKNNTTNNER